MLRALLGRKLRLQEHYQGGAHSTQALSGGATAREYSQLSKWEEGMIWILGKGKYRDHPHPNRKPRNATPNPFRPWALVSGQAAVTRQQKSAGEDAVVAKQPLLGLTCHLPDIPGSHNSTGREAWTSGVWRVEYPGVRKLGEKGKDGDTHRDT